MAAKKMEKANIFAARKPNRKKCFISHRLIVFNLPQQSIFCTQSHAHTHTPHPQWNAHHHYSYDSFFQATLVLRRILHNAICQSWYTFLIPLYKSNLCFCQIWIFIPFRKKANERKKCANGRNSGKKNLISSSCRRTFLSAIHSCASRRWMLCAMQMNWGVIGLELLVNGAYEQINMRTKLSPLRSNSRYRAAF